MYVGKDISYNTLLNPVYLSTTANTAIFAVFSRVVNRQMQVKSSNDSIEIKPFVLPKETMMALEFRSFETLEFHRPHYQSVLKELLECFDKPEDKSIIRANDSVKSEDQPIKHIKRKRPQNPAEPDFVFENRKAILKRMRQSPDNSKQVTPELYDPTDLKKYNELLNEYFKLLIQQRNFHAKLHNQLTFLGVTSYIPTPWSILFTEKPFTPRFTPGIKVDLRNAELVRANLKCPTEESAKQKYMSIFEPYKSIDLSENNLSGPGKFGFHWLVELKIHNCQLQSLSSIKGFTSLRHLDVSENRISSDLSLETFLKPLASLTCLNISNNTLNSIEDFSLLTNLQTLDVSGNLITTLVPLSGLPIVTLNASYTSVAPNELMLPDELSKLETLLLYDCKNDPENGFTQDDFKKRYPALRSLTLEEDSEIKW
jgi:hypothetical protein